MQTNLLVYIVDDSSDYRFLLETIFSRQLPIYQPRFFESGDAMIYNLFRGLERPGLVLLDRHMPGRNGYHTLAIMKQHPDWKVVPVVMISSDASWSDMEECYRSGANSFLRKPTDFGSLQQLMESTCQYWLSLNQSV